LPLPARFHAVAVLVVSVTMASLDGTIMNLALPSIVNGLGVSAADSIWVVSAYQLAALTLLLPLATMGDRGGYRRVYLGGIAVFTVASALCVTSHSLSMLVASRALQGAGASGIMAANGALLRLTYPKRFFGRGVAINSATIAAASAAGPSVAAAVLSIASWPWLFAINLPLGIIAIGFGLRTLPHNVVRASLRERTPVLDVALNICTFGLLLLGAQAFGNDVASVTSVRSLGAPLALLASGTVVGAYYVRRQSRRATPLFPIDLLKIPMFRLSVCTSIISFSAQTIAYIALPFLMLGDWHRNAGEAGLLLSLWPCMVVLAAVVVGPLIGRYPGGLLGAVGLAVMSMGLWLLTMLPSHASLVAVGWRIALCGLGFGLFQSPNNHAILSSAPPHRAGAAGGMQGTARLVGQTLGGALLMFVFSLEPPIGTGGPIHAIALAGVLAAAASMVSALRLRHTLVQA
jgi:DHA2 family multidrug resistance protein-like MFS transporter